MLQLSFRLIVKEILRDDFIEVRAIYDFVFHSCSLKAKYAERKEGFCE
jgi:hypothetical protein